MPATAGLLDVGPGDLRADNRLVERQLAVEFFDRLRLGGQVDDGVDAFGLFVDFVGKPALAPNIDVFDRSAILTHHIEVRIKAGGNGAFLEIRIEDDHQFITTQGDSTSFGLGGYGLSVAGGRCVRVGPGWVRTECCRNRHTVVATDEV